MSDEGQSVVEGQEPSADVKSLMGEIQKLRSTNERLLEESKSHKSKYQEVAGTLDTIERERLEKEGKTDEILLKEREEKAKIMEDLKMIKSKTLKANVKNSLYSKAKDAHSIDDLLSLKQASMIEYDEETLEPVQDTLDQFVNLVREEKPYLFGSKKVAPMAEGKPKAETTNKKPSIDDALGALLQG